MKALGKYGVRPNDKFESEYLLAFFFNFDYVFVSSKNTLLFDPERVHYFTMNTLSSMLKLSFIRSIFKRKFLIENQNLVTNALVLNLRIPLV